MNEENKKNNVAEKVLAHIEKNDISPKPRWHFILKNEVFWGLGIISIVVGALAFSTLIFAIANADFETMHYARVSVFSFLLNWTPFVWVVLFIAFILVGYETVRHTKKGYKYPIWAIAIVTFLLTFSLGYAFYTNGYAHIIDRQLGGRFPFGRSVVDLKRDFWMNPKRGMMAGRVQDYSSSTMMMSLVDFRDKSWPIALNNLENPEVLQFIKDGNIVKVIADTDLDYDDPATNTIIRARAVLPFEIKGSPGILPPDMFYMMGGRSGPGRGGYMMR